MVPNPIKIDDKQIQESCETNMDLESLSGAVLNGAVLRDEPTPFWLTWSMGHSPWRIHGTKGIFAYIYDKTQPNVGKDTIHGSYGYWLVQEFNVQQKNLSSTEPWLLEKEYSLLLMEEILRHLGCKKTL